MRLQLLQFHLIDLRIDCADCAPHNATIHWRNSLLRQWRAFSLHIESFLSTPPVQTSTAETSTAEPSFYTSCPSCLPLLPAPPACPSCLPLLPAPLGQVLDEHRRDVYRRDEHRRAFSLHTKPTCLPLPPAPPGRVPSRRVLDEHHSRDEHRRDEY
jgi:hypothetical protein